MYGLVPHPRVIRPQRGSPRMFESGWIERYFSRVRPSHVVAIWIPVALFSFWRAVRAPVAAPGWQLFAVAMGVVLWTLLEYVLHRFLFHFVPDESSDFQKETLWLIHGVHHDYPWDGDRLVMPPTPAAVIAVALWFPLHWLFGPCFWAGAGGIVLGYVCYDLTHYHLHHGKPTTSLGKWLRTYHLAHHFSAPNVRYGVTTPVWDLVFGTYPQRQHPRACSRRHGSLGDEQGLADRLELHRETVAHVDAREAQRAADLDG